MTTETHTEKAHTGLPRSREARAQAPTGMRLSLFWRVFLPNALVLGLAVAVLSLSPARVPAPTSVAKVVILIAGLAAMIVINLVLMRRAFHPLERLTGLMRAVDPLEPGKRIPTYGGGTEVIELTEAFNEMLDRLETERREYARRSLAAEENERRRIALELHDEIGQTMTALMLQLGTAARNSPGQSSKAIAEAADAAHSVLDDVHRIVRELRPEALDDLGLALAVDSLCARITTWTGVRVSRKLDPEIPDLSPEEELVIYRVAQESLTNAVRHSTTEAVVVSLMHADGEIELIVRDRGIGISEDAALGTGVRGMRERALLIGASLSISAPADGGTEVRLVLPVRAPPSLHR